MLISVDLYHLLRDHFTRAAANPKEQFKGWASVA
jgi:hypothetical protein